MGEGGDGVELSTAISIVAAISGILLGWWGATRNAKKDIVTEVRQEASTSIGLKTDMEYIKRGVDDIRVDVRMQGQRVDGLAERVTRVEESSKQAHKRLDRLEDGDK